MRKKDIERKWLLYNIYVLYKWIVGMLFFFKMCILLSKKNQYFFWKPSLTTTLQKTSRFMFLICLWFEDKMKNNRDLLWFSENREKHSPVRHMRRYSLMNCHLFVLIWSWKLIVSIFFYIWIWKHYKFLIWSLV